MEVVVDKAYSRGYANHGWLKTYHTFSFADYYNPKRMGFGMLRVLNDDTVAPEHGFGMHQHKNMEVVSIPLKGFLRHSDSMENSGVISPGQIQVMSAGTGIFHSEYNDSSQENVEFLQIWVSPREENTEPHYQDYDIRAALRENDLSLIISPNGTAPATIQQDAWFSLGTLEKGEIREYRMHTDYTGVYIFIIEGEIVINELVLSRRDGAGFTETQTVMIETQEKAQLLLIEVPAPAI